MNCKNLFIIGCALLAGCANRGNNVSQYNHDNTIFSGYLNRLFHSSIADDSTNYVLVPETSCPGCVVNSLSCLRKSKKSKIILNEAMFNKLKNSKDFELTSNFSIDTNDELNQLTYSKCNICVIQVSDKKIYNILPGAKDADLASLK